MIPTHEKIITETQKFNKEISKLIKNENKFWYRL